MHSVFIQEYSLNSEFNLLKYHVGPGVYVIPAAKTPFIWFGIIFIRSGFYESGIFRFRLFIPHTFPECSSCPKLIFETPVYHPQINPLTHELSLSNCSPLIEWRKDVSHLWQVISYMRTVFYSISVYNAVHKEAANMYEAHREEFIKKSRECVENSKLRIYDKSSNDDPHYLLFDKYNSEIHEPFREILLKEKNSVEIEEGHAVSWVRGGTLVSLSEHY